MNFKFLANISDGDAATFLQELLWKIGDSFDDKDLSPVIDLIVSWQTKSYGGEKRNFEYTDTPFTKPVKKLSESKLALITSTGHFVEGDDPEPFGVKDMTQEEAVKRIFEFIKEVPELSKIPFNTPKEKLRVRHGGYDIRGVQSDPEVALPLKAISDMANDGMIGEISSAYSFVGACSQLRFIKETAPKWAESFKNDKTDVALLVPV